MARSVILDYHLEQLVQVDLSSFDGRYPTGYAVLSHHLSQITVETLLRNVADIRTSRSCAGLYCSLRQLRGRVRVRLWRLRRLVALKLVRLRGLRGGIGHCR